MDLHDGYVEAYVHHRTKQHTDQPKVIEYLAYRLIDGYKSGDGNATAFLDHYDFYLVPFHNPDGKQSSPLPRSKTLLIGKKLH